MPTRHPSQDAEILLSMAELVDCRDTSGISPTFELILLKWYQIRLVLGLRDWYARYPRDHHRFRTRESVTWDFGDRTKEWCRTIKFLRWTTEGCWLGLLPYQLTLLVLIKARWCPAHSDLFHFFAQFWWSDKNFMILELYGEAISLISILLPETATRIYSNRMTSYIPFRI